MGRHHAVIVVGGGDEYCRVWSAVVFDVMQGGILKQVGCHFRRVGACAVIGRPVPADGEKMISHHIHNTHAGDGYAEKLGTHVGDSPDQQTSVASTFDYQVI